MKYHERREFPRAPASLTVQYRDGEELKRDLVENQSPGGLFIRTRRPLPIGSEFDLVVEIAGDPPTRIQVRGRVVWERLYGRNAPPHEPEGMGIAFIGDVDPRLQVDSSVASNVIPIGSVKPEK